MFEVLVYAAVIVGVLAFCGERKPAAVVIAKPVIETEAESSIVTESQVEADLEMSNYPVIAEVPEVLEVAEIAAVFTADEQITTAVTTDYKAMSIVELKALGKQYNIPGWKAWKKPQTAIARLEAIAA